MKNHKRFGPRAVGVAALLTAVVFVAFWPALGADFVAWDDDLNLTGNPRYRGFSWVTLRWIGTTTLGGHYHPLTWLSWTVDHLVWGMDPRGYHLTNVALHAVGAVLFHRVACRLLQGTRASATAQAIVWPAAVGALFFAVHPLRVESVAWISERRDVLSSVFYMLALLGYLRMVDVEPTGARRRWLGASLGCFVLSLLSKAWGMTFPIVLLILDVYPLRRPARTAWSRLLAEKALYAVPAVLAAGAAFVAQRSVDDMRTLVEHSLGARLAQAAYGLCFYPWKTLLPFDLNPLYLLESGFDPWAPRWVLSAVLVAILTVAAFGVRGRWPWVLAAWTAYAVIVSPVLGIAQTGPQLVADRYSYLSCLPFALLVAALVRALWLRAAGRSARGLLVGGCVVVVMLLAGATCRQTRVWTDSHTLWTHAIRLDPGNHIAYTNRAFAESDPALALADYAEALRLAPRFYLAYFNRAEVRQALGDYAGAIADNTAAIEILPGDPKAYNNRGWVREELGDWTGAVADYERALARAPEGWTERALVEGNLARARAQSGAP